jgi:hypothetical protein
VDDYDAKFALSVQKTVRELPADLLTDFLLPPGWQFFACFSHCQLAAFEERSSAVPTRARGRLMAIGRLGFSTGFASLRGFSALRFAIMP